MLYLKANGRKDSTAENYGHLLKQLAQKTDLTNPEQVKLTIANLTTNNKENFCKAYNALTKANKIEWKKPYYRNERKIPIIPTKENIIKIISQAKKYAVIFQILMETGLMPYELSQIQQKDIDFQNRILTAKGYKGHTSRTFKLTQQTINMLNDYFVKYKTFPESTWIKKMWIKARAKAVKKFQEPALANIRLYDLRHYYATTLYKNTNNILLVKQQLGHRKIETTMIYTQLTNTTEEEYVYQTAKTIQEATKLIEEGFEYITEIDGIKLFRKRK